MVLAAVLPIREFDTQLALDILAYHQQRNHAAYLSHRKRRIALAHPTGVNPRCSTKPQAANDLEGPIQCHERLGGTLKFYARKVA